MPLIGIPVKWSLKLVRIMRRKKKRLLLGQYTYGLKKITKHSISPWSHSKVDADDEVVTIVKVYVTSPACGQGSTNYWESTERKMIRKMQSRSNHKRERCYKKSGIPLHKQESNRKKNSIAFLAIQGDTTYKDISSNPPSEFFQESKRAANTRGRPSLKYM